VNFKAFTTIAVWMTTFLRFSLYFDVSNFVLSPSSGLLKLTRVDETYVSYPEGQVVERNTPHGFKMQNVPPSIGSQGVSWTVWTPYRTAENWAAGFLWGSSQRDITLRCYVDFIIWNPIWLL